ncbi:MAG: hypothetical protein IJL44_06085 [Bacteroidales bacterium]|jgi:hypothetical protein|nr:hypothetical protein [Bacteroidales bacterium]
MKGKLNIARWVFLALAAVTVIIAVLYYLVVGTIKPEYQAGNPTPRADLFLNWGYILIILGIVAALISAVVAALVKGVNVKKILFAVGAIVIIGLVAFLMSRGSFGVPYQAADHLYSGRTHGWVELGLNFFYVTLGVSIICIIYSAIRSGK